MRPIDADELMELYDGCDGLSVPIAVVRQNIEDAPTIDADPVRHGHWVACTLIREIGNLNGFKCSICGNEKAGRYLKYNYRPNCGAKMDEVMSDGLRICVKYRKAADALCNAEFAADAIEQLVRERDAAVADLHLVANNYFEDYVFSACICCKKNDTCNGQPATGCEFEWRGVQEVSE